jgi:CubicO group peptidase (beta-lactamase class C family)
MITFRTFLSITLAALLVSACITDNDVKQGYHGFQPVQANDGWVTSSPALEHMDNTFLESAYHLVYSEDRFVMARSLLILRNGKLVAEAYPHDDHDRDQIQNLQSCTKSITSILTGIAFDKRLLDSVGQRLSEILPEEFANHPDKADITIEDALTMRAGIAFNDDEHSIELYHASGSSVDYVLGLEKNYTPGTVFHYNDGVPQLISASIQQRWGRPLSAFAEEFLFKPLQITDWKWESTQDGRTLGAVSLYLKPRDAAKFGQLLLNNGKWNGQQLVDSTWISKATQPIATADQVGRPYGYYFWVYPAYEGYAALGHGGQAIFAVPSKALVVVYTAWPYTSGDLFDNFYELADLITGSCR